MLTPVRVTVVDLSLRVEGLLILMSISLLIVDVLVSLARPVEILIVSVFSLVVTWSRLILGWLGVWVMEALATVRLWWVPF